MEADFLSFLNYKFKQYSTIYISNNHECKICGVFGDFPLPINLSNNKIIFDGYVCSFECLMNFLKTVRVLNAKNNMKYNYTQNIVWSLLHFVALD